MTNPQFPDHFGMREVVRPGATASKAGPDMLQRVAALEQGALGRPGPEIANGCVITSDITQVGGVKWQMGIGTQAGYGALTTDSTAGDAISFAVTGDGVTPVLIKARFGVGTTSAATTIGIRIRDGSGGGGAQYAYWQQPLAGAGSIYTDDIECVIPAWSGSKTFYLRMDGSGTVTMYGASVLRCWMRAVWAPGYTATS